MFQIYPYIKDTKIYFILDSAPLILIGKTLTIKIILFLSCLLFLYLTNYCALWHVSTFQFSNSSLFIKPIYFDNQDYRCTYVSELRYRSPRQDTRERYFSRERERLCNVTICPRLIYLLNAMSYKADWSRRNDFNWTWTVSDAWFFISAGFEHGVTVWVTAHPRSFVLAVSPPLSTSPFADQTL